MDRISDMPETVLCHILSFIPTKNAVTTSILSRRWRHLWKYLQVFHFSDSPFQNCPTSFSLFVNSVLARRRTREFLQFHLLSECGFAAVDDMATWIRDVAGPHLHELSLLIGTPNDDDDNLRLPLNLFTCKGLVSLSLIGSISVEGLQSVYLPSLKTMDLDIHYVDPTDIVFSFSFSGCPVLENLEIRSSGVNAPKIRAPSSLKRLTFSDITEDDREYLEIDTPSLEYLDITMMSSCSHFSVTNLQKVVVAYLDFNRQVQTHFNFILKLLRALTRTQEHKFWSCIFQRLRFVPVEVGCSCACTCCHPTGSDTSCWLLKKLQSLIEVFRCYKAEHLMNTHSLAFVNGQ